MDAVVHMAELSNDPAGQLAPTITYEINHKGSVHLAELARKAGVKRFVYMSSSSVYSVSEADDLTEEFASIGVAARPSRRFVTVKKHKCYKAGPPATKLVRNFVVIRGS